MSSLPVSTMVEIELLINALKDKGFEGYLITTADEWGNEYPPKCARRLQWLTGFTGSNGIALITAGERIFATDGRYLLQARQELGKQWQIFDLSSAEFNAKLSTIKEKIAFDAMLLSIKQFEKLSQHIDKFFPIDGNIVDELWHDRPAFPQSEVITIPNSVNSPQKIKLLQQSMDDNAQVMLLSAPESIAWLFNMRGGDVEFCPLILAYVLLWKDGAVEIFADNVNLPKEMLRFTKPISILKARYLEIIASGCRVQFDRQRTPYWFASQHSESIIKADPCLLLKACKNEQELEQIRQVHIQDGLALTEFIYWLCTSYQQQAIDELKAAEKLHEFRQQHLNFKGESFATISAFAANASIIHHHPNISSNKKIEGNGLYLVDSGGHYHYGSTDVTRTLAIGKPQQQQCLHYTLVLKGHIALARAIFPEGTYGQQLDILARFHLWQYGLDYAHGTGHGVGHYLNVHEGPPSISKTADSYPLKLGMVVSNEPGYYRDNEYGIRIESLLEVKPAEAKGFLQFSLLTWVPIDCRPIVKDLLNEDELNWLYNYNKQSLDKHRALLHRDVISWYEREYTYL